MKYTILFPRNTHSTPMSLLLLYLRVVFGLLFMLHGIDKLENFASLSYAFPSIAGLGSRLSLIMAIMAELFCAIAVVIGLLFRLALIPIIVMMTIAFSLVHGGSIAHGELALIYLLIFLLLEITGPGKYSVDMLVNAYFSSKERVL